MRGWRIGAAKSLAETCARCAQRALARSAFLLRSPLSPRAPTHARRLPAEDPHREGLRRRDRVAARPGADAVARASATACCSSARTSSRVLLQAARRVQQDGAPVVGRARARRDRASAGNHAQGVALAAQRLGCKATIVMPVTTPAIKIAAVEARGARSCCTATPTATPTSTRWRCRRQAARPSCIRTTIPT